MTKTQVKWGAIAVALLVFAGIKFFAISYFLNKNDAPTVISHCGDLSQPCTLSPQLSVQFAAPPRHGQPFLVRVESTHPLPPVAEFSMADMEMGTARFTFTSASPPHWEAKIMLPVCATGRQDWLMVLVVAGKRLQIPFTAN